MKYLLLLITLVFSMQSFSQSGLGAIRGSVFSADGKPLDSCIVRVLNDGQVLFEVSTKADGKFRIDNIKRGTYVVEVQFDQNYTPLLKRDVMVRPDTITFLDNLTLFKPGEEPEHHKKKKRKHI